jgi:hypothetical protein
VGVVRQLTCVSSGPRTAESLERSRRARWKHGVYSRETRALLAETRRQARFFIAMLKALPPGALDSDEESALAET